VLDQLPLDLFEGVIRELQRMAHLPPVPISQPQQTEIEYLYQQNCVLIRFRFMLGTHGEEATIQVLRGAALKFHQRQQLTKLEHDAMLIAKQLQHKLNEIRARAYSAPSLLEAKPEKLSKLLELLRNIEQQLEDGAAE
jgi:type II secretory ATPase GspE/PulE/Tfp pilus assembly ATPase PilB-like protein